MIIGFVQDIVRGVREFRRSVANIDSIEHSRDAKGSTSEEGRNE